MVKYDQLLLAEMYVSDMTVSPELRKEAEKIILDAMKNGVKY